MPNVIVDGAPTQNTILTLSHWPKSGTPAELKGDTSTEIVFNYLDAPRFHVKADVVSNNHFDEDGLDLAVVRIAERTTPGVADCHSFALHTRTKATRLLIVEGERVELQYPYEGWVQMASRSPAPRVDLAALATELNREEAGGGRWVFDGVDQITPRFYVADAQATSIPIGGVLSRIEACLRTGAPAWDPYD